MTIYVSCLLVNTKRKSLLDFILCSNNISRVLLIIGITLMLDFVFGFVTFAYRSPVFLDLESRIVRSI